MNVERPHHDPGWVADPTVGVTLHGTGHVDVLLARLCERRPMLDVRVHRVAV
jgi:hypothetical protein